MDECIAQVLIEEAEAKKRRKREETRVALDKIKGRIEASLDSWKDASDVMEDEDNPLLDTYPGDVVKIKSEGSSIEVSLDSITDPAKLYELLADVRLRSKYEKKLTVVVVQIEDLQQEKEEVLKSLNHFFEENRESNMNEFIAEIESEEIDIEDATTGIESALETATRAASKLVTIEKELAQLISIASSFPSSKKGRKKLEKALIKAQDELQSMSTTMDGVKKELEESRANCDQLQLTLDTKSKECVKLKKNADQAKKLQLSNDSMKAELSNVSSLLKKAEDEILELQKRPVQPVEPKVIVDDKKIKELEKELEKSKALCESIQAENEEKVTEMENLKSQYEKEIAEMKANHDEQLGSLVIDFNEEIEQVDTDVSDGKEVNDEIREELESKLTEVKNNANKIIASLKVQLANAHEKQEQQKEELEVELQTKQEEKEKQDARISELENALKNMSIELKEISQKQAESGSPMVHLPTAFDQHVQHDVHVPSSSPSPVVRAELPIAVQNTTQLQNSPVKPPTADLPFLHSPHHQLADHSTQWSTAELTSHSTQWSDGVMSSNRTSGSPQSILSEQHPPALQMEEVQMLSPLADKSLMMSLGNASIHHIHGSPQHSGSSPLYSGSIVSGKALTNGEMFLIPNTNTFSISNSPAAAEKRSISPNNPVIQEWSKAVDQIMRFKSNIIEVLMECQMLPSSVTDSLKELQEQEDLRLDKEKDISSQVTQTRFNLALTLHQLETTLKDSINVMNPDKPTCSAEYEENQITSKEDKEEESKKMTKEITKLKKQLQLAEEAHKQELRKNKDTITNLSIKVGMLKTELSTAKHQLSQIDNQSQSSSVFFTRLDYERNRRTLEEAVSSRKITNNDFETMVSNMEDYLTLPGQRLQHIKHHAQQQAGLKKAFTQVRTHSSTPEHTSQVLTMIQQLQKQRKETFAANMKTLSAERLHLAEEIQNALTEVEKQSGLFLIKPIYPTKAHGTHPILTPLNRVPPKYRVPMPTPSSRVSKRETSSKLSQHPTLQLISNIRSELSTRQAASRELPDSRYGLSTEQSTTIPTRPPSTSGPQWSVSHTPTPNIDFTPVLPRLVELEVKQLRNPDFSLSQPSSATSSAVMKEKDSISRSLIRDGKLLHPIKGNIGGNTSSAVTPSGGKTTAGPNTTGLPPIQIPSHYPQQQSVAI